MIFPNINKIGNFFPLDWSFKKAGRNFGPQNFNFDFSDFDASDYPLWNVLEPLIYRFDYMRKVVYYLFTGEHRITTRIRWINNGVSLVTPIF